MKLSEHHLFRFIQKFRICETTGCWLWIGGTNSTGYGCFRIGRSKKSAHVVSYEHFVGPKPEGLELDHLCRVRNCVNPEHLEPVTHAENIRRSPLHPSALLRARMHCPQGHPYSGDNLYKRVDRTGRIWRICVTCSRKRQAVAVQRNLAARKAQKLLRQARKLAAQGKSPSIPVK